MKQYTKFQIGKMKREERSRFKALQKDPEFRKRLNESWERMKQGAEVKNKS